MAALIKDYRKSHPEIGFTITCDTNVFSGKSPDISTIPQKKTHSYSTGIYVSQSKRQSNHIQQFIEYIQKSHQK
jgi:hypothetical protein